MRTVTSKDGTTIAYDQMGEGPALILVGGATTARAAMVSDCDTLKSLPHVCRDYRPAAEECADG